MKKTHLLLGLILAATPIVAQATDEFYCTQDLNKEMNARVFDASLLVLKIVALPGPLTTHTCKLSSDGGAWGSPVDHGSSACNVSTTKKQVTFKSVDDEFLLNIDLTKPTPGAWSETEKFIQYPSTARMRFDDQKSKTSIYKTHLFNCIKADEKMKTEGLLN